VSKALWFPTIWVAIVASRPVGYWLSGSGGNAEVNADLDGSPVDRNVLLGLIVAGIWVLRSRQLDWREIRTRNKALFIFFLYCLISVVWSDYSMIAFKRWIKEVGNVLMILIIATEANPVEAMREVFMRCIYVLVPYSVLTCKYYPFVGNYCNEWTGVMYFCGVTCDKNALGRLALVSIIFLFWTLVDLQRTKGLFTWLKAGFPEWVLLAMCFWLLHISGSATSLGCLLIGGGAFVVCRLNIIKTKPKLAASIACAFLILSMLALAMPDLRRVVTGSMGRNPNLTERTDVWSGALKLNTGPILGAGFASVWLTPKARELSEALNVHHSHNGYLETYLNGGLVGLFLILVVLAAAGKQTLRQVVANTKLGPLYAALFFMGFIYNYTEAALNNSNVIGFILFLLSMHTTTLDWVISPAPTAVQPETQTSHPLPGAPAQSVEQGAV
jgi:exopolysaccharide production protein ExoQ